MHGHMNVKFEYKLLASDMRSSEQPLKLWVFCRVHCTNNSSTRGLKEEYWLKVRRIFGPKRDKVTVHKKLLNQDLYDFCSPYILVIKPRMVRWYEHVAYIGHKRNACSILVGKGEGKRPLGRSGVHGRMILKWILKK